MFSEPQIVIQGNIATGPELRYTGSGRPVIGFTVAQNPRHKNPATGEWEDGTAVFLRVTAWGDLAENVAQSLSRGDPVTVVGRLRQREWAPKATPDNPEPRPQRATEVQADSVAVPMERHIVRLTRVRRDHGPDGAQDGQADAGQVAGADGLGRVARETVAAVNAGEREAALVDPKAAQTAQDGPGEPPAATGQGEPASQPEGGKRGRRAAAAK